MPDISMCENKSCPKNTDCYRYRAVPSYWQSYVDFVFDNEECFAFVPVIEVNAPIRMMDEIEKGAQRGEG